MVVERWIRFGRTPGRLSLTLTLLVIALGACHSSDAALPVGDGCVIKSDCPAPLVCISGTCHIECRNDGDCAAGARCVDGSCAAASSGADGGALPSVGLDASEAGNAADPSPGDAGDGGRDDASADGAPPVGASDGGEAGAPSSDGSIPCQGGGTELGQIAYWCSKVNVHLTASGWVGDDDCKSGCLAEPLQYCQTFWPASASYEELATVTPDLKPFSLVDCQGVEYSPGQVQFRCCAAP